MNEDMMTVSFYAPTELMAQVDEAVKEQDMTRSAFIRKAMERYLAHLDRIAKLDDADEAPAA